MPDKWDYGGAFERYPCESGTIVFDSGSRLKVHDIFEPLPKFMTEADVIFTDSPWNTGNLRSFYTKADRILLSEFTAFYKRLFECVKNIHPHVCYLEIGKEFLPEFVIEMRHIYKYVTFYNSSYYHKQKNHCYVVRGSQKARAPKLDDMDEETIIEWVCENENYNCIGDLCMGRGLVAINAAKNKKQFVGTELNHKRLSVAIERLAAMGLKYRRKENES